MDMWRLLKLNFSLEIGENMLVHEDYSKSVETLHTYIQERLPGHEYTVELSDGSRFWNSMEIVTLKIRIQISPGVDHWIEHQFWLSADGEKALMGILTSSTRVPLTRLVDAVRRWQLGISNA